MNKLNVFNISYSPWKYPSNWIRNMRLFGRQFKWAYQRITRGFCDYDVWDLDTYLSELLAQSIEHLAKTSHSYPGTEEFPTYDSWESYLMEISNKLKYSLSELPNEYEDAWFKTWKNKEFNKEKTPEEEAIIKDYLDKELTNDNLKRKAQNQALFMLFHAYNHLWD